MSLSRPRDYLRRGAVLVTRSVSSGCLLCGVCLRGGCGLVQTRGNRRTVSGFLRCDPTIVLVSVNVPIISNCRTARTVHRLSSGMPVITIATFTCSRSGQGMVSENFGNCLSGPLGGRTLFSVLHRVKVWSSGRWSVIIAAQVHLVWKILTSQSSVLGYP